MKTKSLVVVIAAVFAVFAIVGTALAVDRADLKVTSEPIKAKATCDKAGGISIEFNQETELKAGDKITMDLDYGVTLCNSFDMIIAPEVWDAVNAKYLWVTYDEGLPTNQISVPAGLGWNKLNIPIEKSPVVATTDTLTGPGADVTTNGTDGVVFRVYGSAGSQRITMDVLGSTANATLRVLTDQADGRSLLTIYAFDQRTNADALIPRGDILFNTKGIWFANSDTDYTTSPTVATKKLRTFKTGVSTNMNALCINVSGFNYDTVKLNFDSINDKFTFNPSNPQVAHIVSASAVTPFPCKLAKLGNIAIPSTQGSCVPFNYQTGSGYCGNHSGNKLVLQSTTPFDNAKYYVRMTIKEPSNVWWSGNGVTLYGLKDPSCTESGIVTGSLPAVKYYAAGGIEIKASELQTATGCVVPDKAKIKSFITDSNKFIGTNEVKGIYIEIPNLIYDSGVQAGQKVVITVELIKLPCGLIWSGDVELGTFGCDTSTKTTLVYPYFDLSTEGWWNGLAVTNLTSTATNVKLYWYEVDGGKGVKEIALPANGMAVNLVDSFLEGMANTGTGELGDSRGYVIICSPVLADGFAMIGSNNASVDGSETMGYLPRTSSGAGISFKMCD